MNEGMIVSTLTEEDVLAIHEAAWAGEPQDITARDFGITQQTVSAIKTGKVWSAVTGQVLMESHRAKLTIEEVQLIDAGLRAGVSGSALAREFVISPQLISNIKRGRDWTWVTGREPTRRNTL